VSSEQKSQSSAAGEQGPGEPTGRATEQGQGGPMGQAQPSEEELRAAYEAELNRITAAEMIVQTAVSLINIGGRRLGLAAAAPDDDPSVAASAGELDLEQARDAIDGASALLPILERRMPGELSPLRDAIAQLKVAYAREAQASATASASTGTSSSTSSTTSPSTPSAAQPKPTASPAQPTEADRKPAPGPAQSSGRLWVPGR
jgi:hypothetical protein